MSFAAQINSVMAALILLTAFGLLVQRRILGLLHLFAWQGLFLCLSTAIVGYVTGVHHLFISSIIDADAQGFRASLYPLCPDPETGHQEGERVAGEHTQNDADRHSAGDLFLSLDRADYPSFDDGHPLDARRCPGNCYARSADDGNKKACRHPDNRFLAMENGLFFAATSATYGMPMVVELGVALDLLIAAFIFGIFFFHISTTFDSLDVEQMAKLKEED